jgi:hypothetical protein
MQGKPILIAAQGRPLQHGLGPSYLSHVMPLVDMIRQLLGAGRMPIRFQNWYHGLMRDAAIRVVV